MRERAREDRGTEERAETHLLGGRRGRRRGGGVVILSVQGHPAVLGEQGEVLQGVLPYQLCTRKVLAAVDHEEKETRSARSSLTLLTL